MLCCCHLGRQSTSFLKAIGAIKDNETSADYHRIKEKREEGENSEEKEEEEEHGIESGDTEDERERREREQGEGE